MKWYLLLWLLFLPATSNAQSHWSLELSAGSALNFGTTLNIERPGQEISIDADYETRGFEGPLYYAWRIGRGTASGAWEFEWIHHKIFLQNTSDVVQSFAVSHGYNMLFVNRSWPLGTIAVLRTGAGAVLAHPETRIADVSFQPGYELTGPAGQLSLGLRFFISQSWFLQAESKFTAARARLTVPDGEASVPNVALHFLGGIGFRL